MNQPFNSITGFQGGDMRFFSSEGLKEKARKFLDSLLPRPQEPRLVPVRIPVRRPRR